MEDLHSKLLQTRKEIYLRLKETAVGYDVQHSAELEDYYNAQETYEKKDFEVSLLRISRKVQRSQIIYLETSTHSTKAQKTLIDLSSFFSAKKKNLLSVLKWSPPQNSKKSIRL